MFKIQKIENSSYYIDKAIKEMEEFATKTREEISQRFSKSTSTFDKSKDDNNLNKRKDLELEKIRYLNQNLNRRLKKIITSFPKMKNLDEIYIKLINTNEFTVNDISDALSRILWILNQVDDYTQNFQFKIKKAHTQKTIGFLMGKYLGKVNSLFRKNKNFFRLLEDSRKYILKLPKFEDLYTVSIAGFPNVGKSTMMKNITGSNVEIQNYPFTTKGLMFGYIYNNDAKSIQLIDTPGLLNRDKKTNGIETRAKIVIDEYCSLIIFVLDITESCGYDIQAQMKLLKQTAKNKKTVIYFSKTDLYNEEDDANAQEISSKFKKLQQFKDYNEVKDHLLKVYKSQLKEFDPRKLNIIK